MSTGHAAIGGALVESPVAQVRFTGAAAPAAPSAGLWTSAEAKRSRAGRRRRDARAGRRDATRAARGAVWAAFANAGQSGGSVGRAICLHKVGDRFVDAVVAGAGALRIGDPADPATEIGSLVASERMERLVALIDDADQPGATLHCGGRVSPDGIDGAFFPQPFCPASSPRSALA